MCLYVEPLPTITQQCVENGPLKSVRMPFHLQMLKITDIGGCFETWSQWNKHMATMTDRCLPGTFLKLFQASWMSDLALLQSLCMILNVVRW